MKDDHYDLMSQFNNAPLPSWALKPEGHEESPPLNPIASGRWNYHGIAEEAPVTPVKGSSVFRPEHYNKFWPEAVTVINAWGLNFNKGNAVKYIARAGHKNNEEEDLGKAIRYLQIELECIRRRKLSSDPKQIWGETL